MISTSIRFSTSLIFTLVRTLVVANPQNDGSWSSSIGPNDSITFTSYNGYFNLRPCLRDIFGNNGATINQIAENVGCDTNSCLCHIEKIESNVEMLSTQVPSRCTDIRAEDIPKATSVLSGYCANARDSPATFGTENTQPVNSTLAHKTTDTSKTAEPSTIPTINSTPEQKPELTPEATSEPSPDSSTEPSLELPNNKLYTTEASGPTTLVTEIITSTSQLNSSSASTPGPSSAPGDGGKPNDPEKPREGLSDQAKYGIISACLTAAGVVISFWVCCFGPCSGWRGH